MNQIQQLINQMCPNGVEWKTLGEVFETRNGYTPSTNNQEFWDDGTIPWFKMEDIRENGRILSDSINHITAKAIKGKGLFKANSVILATSATIGEHALITVEHLSNQRFTNFYPQKEYIQKLDMKFVYYYFYIIDSWCKEHTVQGNFAGVNMTELYNCTIPLPPLAIQTCIVEILDHFTNLTANLTAELNLRRKQFEHYREKLLLLDGVEGVEWKKLGEVISDLRTGLNPRIHFKLNTDDAHDYYITVRELKGFDFEVDEKTDRINNSAVLRINERSKLKIGDILFSGTGTIGRTALIKRLPTNYNIKEGVYAITPKTNIIDSKFLIYLLHTDLIMDVINSKSGGSTVRSISMAELKNIPLPIPSLKIQHSIVSILDKFTALIENIEKELALRQKQYEYYREQLLTFKS